MINGSSLHHILHSYRHQWRNDGVAAASRDGGAHW